MAYNERILHTKSILHTNETMTNQQLYLLVELHLASCDNPTHNSKLNTARLAQLVTAGLRGLSNTPAP